MSGSPNFGFLSSYNPKFVELGAAAERYFSEDPNTCLFKLRQLGELLAHTWICEGSLTPPQTHEKFVDLINRLFDEELLGRYEEGYRNRTIYHRLRIVGNTATHEYTGSHSEALQQLKMARHLAILFHKTISDTTFKAGPFVPPSDPGKKAKALVAELARLKKILDGDKEALDSYKVLAEETKKKWQESEAQVKKFAADSEEWKTFAQELEDEFQEELKKKDEELAKAHSQKGKTQSDIDELVKKALDAAGQLQLDEVDTRYLIDVQLNEAHWNANSSTLSYKSGARPTKGLNQAIAEWPTKKGPADYVLFMGLQAVAVVEAKKSSKDVSSAVEQAKRYSRSYEIKGDEVLLGGPWGDYKVPFMFSTNGRPFLRQLRTKSGIWFLDGRRKQNLSRPLEHWYTPEGIKKLLKQDIDAAQKKLALEPVDLLPMRHYQQSAIRAIEEKIEEGKARSFLLAMATGTGKTRTAIGLIYRLIKSQRFQRVLFVVDRTSLGEQATDSFKTLKLEQNQTFADIYNIKELGDIKPDGETRLQFATIQGLIQRLFFSKDDDFLPVDQYDCIVVDEAHRGYNLDRELSDAELTFRSEADYISKYMRVLDHFDAVKIALTATPATHTTELFGEPVFEYSYRQAVVEGFLIDFEPPLQIKTRLARDGISWDAGEEVEVLVPTGVKNEKALEKYTLPDQVNFEVENFNRRVITESFNEVVCQSLARHIDPALEGKTLVFCATDLHADMVVDILKRTLAEQYGEIEENAVIKITGNADKPLQLIKRFKNERQPQIVVTVDLLTTGIDVPRITNLVFLRRVRSRILYEQMIGRATRRCDEIGKETFRIFDAVDIYSGLQDVTDMKPVVAKANVTFEQLQAELGVVTSEDAKTAVVEQYLAKLHRKASKLKGPAKTAFEALAEEEPKELVTRLRESSVEEAATWIQANPAVSKYLDKVSVGTSRAPIISEVPDELLSEERGFGGGQKPGDYLESFREFLTDNLNKVPALIVVTQRPRELTRKHLQELRRVLDEAGYSEPYVQAAWRDETNEDIAARIIGFVRRQALGSPLIDYDERVSDAMKRLLKSRAWTNPQRQWLERIAKQLKVEIVVDKEALDRGVFKSKGGFNRLNKIFEGQLEQVLGDLNEEVWADAS